MGHVRMMGAVQPFLSGAISKTVNMPEAATAEEIEQVYLEGWKLGLKAIAIYRDNSQAQPAAVAPARRRTATRPPTPPMPKSSRSSASSSRRPRPRPDTPHRRRLPSERTAVTHKFDIAGHEGYITVGLYPDGQPGEIFLKMAKEGSTVAGLMDTFATTVSVALQYGVPLRDLVNKFAHVRFEPAGFTGNQEIPIAKSIVDYIFRWLGSRFLSAGRQGDPRAHRPLGDRGGCPGLLPGSRYGRRGCRGRTGLARPRRSRRPRRPPRPQSPRRRRRTRPMPADGGEPPTATAAAASPVAAAAKRELAVIATNGAHERPRRRTATATANGRSGNGGARRRSP